MITTFLVVHPWITTLALAVSVVVGPLAGYVLADRRKVALWVGWAGLAPVAALTLFPTSRQLRVGCAAEWSFPSLSAVELMANVVLFIVPVLFLGVATRRPVWVFLGAGVLSATIETIQAFVTALGRSCSTNDWLSNSIGAAVGGALALVVIEARARAARRRLGAQATSR